MALVSGLASFKAKAAMLLASALLLFPSTGSTEEKKNEKKKETKEKKEEGRATGRIKLSGTGTDVQAERDGKEARPKARSKRRRRRASRKTRRTRRPRATTGSRTRTRTRTRAVKHGRWLRPSPVWKEKHRQGRKSDPQYYAGVVPGKNHPPPGGIPARAEPCFLTWPGFQLTPGGSRIFFQLTSKPAHQMVMGERRITITFEGCRVRMPNNRRKIVTRYFPTPVVSVTFYRNRRKGTIHAILRMRAKAEPKARWVKDGRFYYYFLDFGPYRLSRDLLRTETRKKRRIRSSEGYIRVRR